MVLRFERLPYAEGDFKYVVKNHIGQEIYIIGPYYNYITRTENNITRRKRTIWKRFWKADHINPVKYVVIQRIGNFSTYSHARKAVIEYEKKHHII